MNKMKRAWWTLFGGWVGALLGILATIVLVELVVLQNPDDPSARSAGIALIVFLPAGLMIGLVVGLVASIVKRGASESDDVPIRSRRSYVTLGILCGLAGGHNYYAGYYGRAIAQLSITMFLIPFGPLITCLWAAIDLFRVTQDANGERMI